ncbi:hypothetical protein QVG61_00460 [Thiohalobacter sp. IOR34]|uniref:hypothetical protein n=1 Tax=Thiohalobacter sp. IOR34 TaxID=3057176 RepID=UPI0025B05FBB|nr:hypothetical protein [Thiohalobacter sp. IOR34]WJW75597.1 hypothetical protein QVG61_00460 [Thiohalobacter sp. IOR34]
MPREVAFSLVHIDAARNATDDFNPFHDKTKWREIHDNPFGGPIALGFQLLALVAERLREHRERQDETALIEQRGLGFSHYQVNFANVVQPDAPLEIEIRGSRLSEAGDVLSNRFSLKAAGRLALLGFKKEASHPLVLEEADFRGLPALEGACDRSILGDSGYFFKRKYLNVSNAKNFLVGSGIEQTRYFDELEGRVRFPEIFPVAYISCALLEWATLLGHDFRADPMVYVSQQISIDRSLSAGLASNDMLALLVRKLPLEETPASDRENGYQTYHCFGLLDSRRILFRAQISLAPLHSILAARPG